VKDPLTCDMVDERDLVASYVSGQLGQEEEERLEAHCLECENCWAALQLALKVRGATIQGSRQQRGFTGTSLLRAVRAAAIVILALGAGWLLRREQPSDVTDIERSASSIERVQIAIHEGGAIVSWLPVDGATRYVATVTAPDGRLVISREVTSARVDLDAATVMTPGATMTIDAYSAIGDRLAATVPTAIEALPRAPAVPVGGGVTP
jgi:hypothetical protein